MHTISFRLYRELRSLLKKTPFIWLLLLGPTFSQMKGNRLESFLSAMKIIDFVERHQGIAADRFKIP
jgi:hypothetical protein